MQPIGTRSILGLNTPSGTEADAAQSTSSPSLRERGQQLVAGLVLATLPTSMMPTPVGAQTATALHAADGMDASAAGPLHQLGQPVRIPARVSYTDAEEQVPRDNLRARTPAVANAATQAITAADRADTAAANDMRDRAMQVFLSHGTDQDKDWAERYFRENDPDRKALLFASALGQKFLEQQQILPNPGRQRGNSVGFWRTLFAVVSSQFLPGDTFTAIAQINTAGGVASAVSDPATFNPFAFNIDHSDTRAKIANTAAQSVIREYLSPVQADSYPTDPVVERTQNFVQALMNMQSAQRWPNVGTLYLSDNTGYTPGSWQPTRGGFGKMLVGMFLGTNSREFLSWDSDKSERRRGEAVNTAIGSMLQRAQMVLADPPQMSVEDFKDQVQFTRWNYNSPDAERAVAEAFGKEGYAKYKQLALEYSRSNNGESMNPERLKEFSDLYRTAVVRVVCWHFAIYLAI